jgi:hypothetical protein
VTEWRHSKRGEGKSQTMSRERQHQQNQKVRSNTTPMALEQPPRSGLVQPVIIYIRIIHNASSFV